MQQAEDGSIKPPLVVGPAYTSRVLAMCHTAIYDAYVGFSRDAATYLDYGFLPKTKPGAFFSRC